MPRIAFFDKKEPTMVGDKAVCQCGLSEDFPFCNGSHEKTKDEDPMKVYQYVDGERMVVGELHHHDHGDGCGCDGHDDDECCGKGDGSCKDDKEGDHDCGCGHEH